MKYTIAFSVMDPETGRWTAAVEDDGNLIWYDTKEEALKEAHEIPNLVWIVGFEGDNPQEVDGPYGDYLGLQYLPPEIFDQLLQNEDFSLIKTNLNTN